MPTTTPSIGDNVKLWRKARGLTQEELADAAGPGCSRTYINHIENGRRAVQHRDLLYALAEALSVQVADLTGQPYGPTDRDEVAARTAVTRIEHALMAAGSEPIGGQLRPPAALADAAELALRQRMAGEYAALGHLAPALITELHTHTARGTDPDTTAAALTRVLVAVAIGMKELGFTTLAYLAATQAEQAALTPADAAAAAYAQSQVLLAVAAVDKAANVAARAAARAAATTAGTDPDTLQMRGMLHLQAALCHTALAVRRGAAAPTATAAAAEHRDHAADLARHTGEGRAYALRFGPTNVAVWDLSLALERDEPARVAQLAPAVDLTQLDTPNRRARLFLEQGRAYARDRKPNKALEALLRAEQAAPAYVRSRPVVRELTGQLMRDARRRALATPLADFARRVGAGAGAA